MLWRIIPLDLGRIESFNRRLLWEENIDDQIDTTKRQIPVIAWLLINDQTRIKILVDSGGGEEDEYMSQYNYSFTCERKNYLEAALEKHDTTVNEIEIIILTHLHWDHAKGVLKLPHAKVIVQKAELQYAIISDDDFSILYEVGVPNQLPYFIKYFSQIQTVSGDVEFIEGIKLLFLPGHSAGSQGVMVDTHNGKYIIPGDLVNLKRNWENSIPPGIHNNLADCYRSIEKLRKIAAKNNATILFSHDFASFELLKTMP